MKRSMTRKLLSLAGSLVVGAGLLVGTAGPAAAAPCSGSHLGNWSISGGYIAIYYNSSTGYNCALTYTNNPGVSQHIMVSIGVSGSSTSYTDSGTYKYYAGPRSVYARGKCIDFSGEVGNRGIEGVINAYCG